MAHKVTIEIPSRPVGFRDIVFRVRKNGTKFGELLICQGAVLWIPAEKSKGRRLAGHRLTTWPKSTGSRFTSDLSEPPLRSAFQRQNVQRVCEHLVSYLIGTAYAHATPMNFGDDDRLSYDELREFEPCDWRGRQIVEQDNMGDWGGWLVSSTAG